MTDDPLRAELIAELCRLHDSVASLDYIDGPDLWADALLPLFAARVAPIENDGPLADWFRPLLAEAWDEGWSTADIAFGVAADLGDEVERPPNPYRAGEGTPAACNCGFGGFHDDINPRCDLNQPSAEGTPAGGGE